MKEHDDHVIEKILSLGKRDILFVLGDFLFDGKHYDEYIKRLSEKKCRIKLIMGNHDSLKLYKEDIIEVQLPLFSYKEKWVTHCPIHPDELRGRIGCVHGHLHLEHVQKVSHQSYKIKDERYFNVNLDVNDYQFIELETINEYFKGK